MQDNPTVFISYSWEEEDHNLWVLYLADLLRKEGVKSELDKYYMQAGMDELFFSERILKSDKVITVLTPKYKLKADGRLDGVGNEMRLIASEYEKAYHVENKIIPIIRKGNKDESLPNFFGRGIIYIDFTNDDNFSASFENLLRVIYNEPAIKIPEIGNKRFFEPLKIEKPRTSQAKLRKNFSLSELEVCLKVNDFRAADIETTRLIQTAYDETAFVLNSKQVKDLPCDVFRDIDKLWLKYSLNKFGYSCQKAVWDELDYFTTWYQRVNAFGASLGWSQNNLWIRRYEHFKFDINAPYGHFPTLRQNTYESADWKSRWLNLIESVIHKTKVCFNL